MNRDDPLQRNIRRTVMQQALRKIRSVVDEEQAADAAAARSVRWLLRYGWIVLLLAAALVGRLMGVY